MPPYSTVNPKPQTPHPPVSFTPCTVTPRVVLTSQKPEPTPALVLTTGWDVYCAWEGFGVGGSFGVVGFDGVGGLKTGGRFWMGWED